MKKTYLDALMSIFTPIPLNNGFYFVDNNGTIDWILSNIFLLGYVLPVEGVMIGIFFYLLLSFFSISLFFCLYIVVFLSVFFCPD